jgi:hypothetical protein
MKINIPQFIADFSKKMDIETYKKQLEKFWLEYQNWWFKPLETFRKEYQEKYGSIFDSNYSVAEDEFERELRNQIFPAMVCLRVELHP